MAPKTRRGKPLPAVPALNNDSDDEEASQTSKNLARLEKAFRGQREFLTKLTNSFNFMSEGFDQLQAQLKSFETENKKMRKDIDALVIKEATMSKRIQELESAAVKAKQHANGNSVVITNLPKINGDLKEVIIGIGEQVSLNVWPDDIIEVFQGENKQFKTHPIIVKMKTSAFKQKCTEFRKSCRQIDVKRILPEITTSKNINFHPLLEKVIAERLKSAKELAKKKKLQICMGARSHDPSTERGQLDHHQNQLG